MFEQRKVGLLAHLERAESIAASQRDGRVQRRRGQRLAGTHAVAQRRPSQDFRHRLRVAGAGVVVRREGRREARVDHAPRGRLGFDAQEERDQRAQHGDHAGFGQRFDAFVADALEVVRAGRAEFRRELCAAAGGQLIDVHANAEPELAPALHQAPRLFQVVDVRLGEDVAVLGEPALGDGGQHLFEQRVDVGLLVVPELEREVVRAQEGRHQLDRVRLVRGRDDAQALQLVVVRQAVAGLGLDGRRTESQEAVHARQEAREQELLARLAHAAHAGQDAAAGLADLDVPLPRHAHLELVLARPREDRVRVRVDEAGHAEAPSRVERHRRGPLRADLRLGSDGDKLVPEDRDRGVPDALDLRERAAGERGVAARRGEFTDAGDEEVGGVHGRYDSAMPHRMPRSSGARLRALLVPTPQAAPTSPPAP